MNRSGFSFAFYRGVKACHVSIRNSFAERAFRMVDESLPEHETEFTAKEKVARKLGVSPEAIRRWKRHAEIDSVQRPGVSSEAGEEIKRLNREHSELRLANEIFKSASAFYASRVSIHPSEGNHCFIDVLRHRFELRGRSVSR